MQLRHMQTVVPAVEGTNKVTAMAWSPNNIKLAIVTIDRVSCVVGLFVFLGGLFCGLFCSLFGGLTEVELLLVCVSRFSSCPCSSPLAAGRHPFR